jgi:hypothetical protein
MSKILPALVVAVDKQQVAVICPFCGRFHGMDPVGTSLRQVWD